ncbi:hypothetical protein WA841_18000 [Pseudomonas aeruginosa]
MLCANLSQYDQAADTMIRLLPLVLGDDTIRGVLKHLDAGHSELRLEVKLRDLGCAVEMEWDSALDAFKTRVDGMSAGLILGDELRGSLGKPVPNNYKTCSVRLSAELDIWRRGVVDLDRGEVLAYTAIPGLATPGASAFLTDTAALDGAVSLDEEGIDALHLELQEFDPGRALFRLGMTDTRRLQDRLSSPEDSDPELAPAPARSPAMEKLEELLSLVADHHESYGPPTPAPSKGLR